MVGQVIIHYYYYGIEQNSASEAGTIFRQDIKSNNRLLKGIQYRR